MNEKIRVCLAGGTGWVGRALTSAIRDSDAFQVVGAVARRKVGEDLGLANGGAALGVPLAATVEDALRAGADVLIDYSHPSAVKEHVLTALRHRVPAVIGTSGLSAADFQEIEALALAQGLGVIAAGNFSITAALAKHFSLIAARFLPHWEIIDYAQADKPDVPSGSTQELAEALARVRKNDLTIPVDQLLGPKEARGASVAGTQIHSVRLPGYTLAFETLFGLEDERLTIRHDAGTGASPYVAGTLLAAERVLAMQGLVRGLDTLLFQV